MRNRCGIVQTRSAPVHAACVYCLSLTLFSTRRLVRWDMRDPTGIVQQSASPIVQYAGGKDYASKVNFNCMATSGAAMTQHTTCKETGLLADALETAYMWKLQP